jgi:hypothetical protein
VDILRYGKGYYGSPLEYTHGISVETCGFTESHWQREHARRMFRQLLANNQSQDFVRYPKLFKAYDSHAQKAISYFTAL